MLDVIGIIYFTLSTLTLLGIFPIGLYEYLDLEKGFTVSDYGVLFETGTYFSISAIITGLLCGLDSITNPIYKKVDRTLYNYHALSSFALLGIGLFPLPYTPDWTFTRLLHWLFALGFLFVYPTTRLLIVKELDRKAFTPLVGMSLFFLLSAFFIALFTQFEALAYPEYILGVCLIISIVMGKIALIKE